MQIFFFGGKSPTDMAFWFVDVQYRAGLSGKCRIDLYQSVRHIFVDSGFADTESFGSLAHSSIMVDNIVSDGNSPFFNIILQKKTP